MSTDAHANPVISLYVGQEGDRVAYGMNTAIEGYAQAGCNMVVDYIAYRKGWGDDLRAKLTGIKAYWIKVHIPLEELEKRERARATLPQGHARSHYATIHWDISYDFEVDTRVSNALSIAHDLKTFLNAQTKVG